MAAFFCCCPVRLCAMSRSGGTSGCTASTAKQRPSCTRTRAGGHAHTPSWTGGPARAHASLSSWVGQRARS
eukprot:472-Pleurochrysis_carterae.AAC.1